MSVNSQLVGVCASTRKAIARSRRMRRAAPTRHEISQFSFAITVLYYMYTVKRHRGEPGHTRDTRRTRAHKQAFCSWAHGSHRRTSQRHNHPNRHQHPRTSERRPKSAADSTAAAPKPTGFLLGYKKEKHRAHWIFHALTCEFGQFAGGDGRGGDPTQGPRQRALGERKNRACAHRAPRAESCAASRCG